MVMAVLRQCICRQRSIRHEFLLRQWQCVKKSLHRGLAEAPAALMRPPMVVLDQPGIEISLQLLDAVVDLLAERDAIELIQYSAMEALTDSIGLRALGLGAAVVDVLDGEVELVFMALGPAKLGAAIGQHARQPYTVLVIDRHHPVVEDLGSSDRGLAVIEFCKADLGVCVDDGLLIDPADALQGTDVKGILRAAIAGAFALELAMRLLVSLGLLERGNLGLDQQGPILRHFGLQRLEAMLHRGQIVPLPYAAHTGGRD